jgi:NTP pyrophosphatase (non-canonical NTP hydrolase)
MEFKDLIKQTREIKRAYEVLNRKQGRPAWLTSDYVQGMVGDVGDLAKLVVKRKQTGARKSIDREIAKELSDILYMVVVIADELGINLEREYKVNLEFLEQKLREEEE